MKSFLCAACMVSLSAAAPVYLSELCKLEKVATHPAVDLNLVTGVRDYVVVSKGYPDMSYIFQVCAGLKYSDTLCSAGSTVCELEKGKTTAKEVYGFVDSIKLEWSTVPALAPHGRTSTTDAAASAPEEAVVMSMVGQKSCAVNPTSEATTKIYFVCNAGAAAEPSVLVESEYGCYVEILFPTPHVCDTPPPAQKFVCEENKCVADPSGTTLAECQGSCSAEKMYSCEHDVCTEVSKGAKGIAKEVCDMFCGGGAPPSPPAGDMFKCHEGKCEVATDGKGVTKEQCEAVCTAPPPPPTPPAGDMFKCHEGKCEVATDGKGVTKEQCEAVCTAPAPPPTPPAGDMFKCHEGKCEVATDGKGVTKAQCEAVCTAPTPPTPPSPPSPPAGDMFKCHEGKCEVAKDGKGVTKEQCEAVCTAPPPPPTPPAGDVFKCHEGKCEVATDGKGVTKAQCEAVCTTPTPTPPTPPSPSPTGDKYKCHQGVCEVAPDGKGVSKAQCEVVCTHESPPLIVLI